MIIKFLKTFLIILLLFVFFQANSYQDELAISDDNKKTIKELKENIDKLDNKQDNLEKEFADLNADLELKSFFKKGLSDLEIIRIKNIVRKYNKNKSDIEKFLEKKAKIGSDTLLEKKSLLNEKKIFYSDLSKYIDIEHKNDYLNYIKQDAIIFTKKKNISTSIITKKEILNKKVEKIEEKIKEHKKIIERNIENIIEKKLDEKIEKLKNNPTFIKLTNELKIKVLDKTLIKLKIKLQNIKNIDDIKMKTFNIAIKKIEEFKNSIK